MRTTTISLSVLCLLSSANRHLEAQCVGDVRDELTGLSTISDSVFAGAFRIVAPPAPPAAGPAPAPAAPGAIPKATVDSVTTMQRLKKALAEEAPFIVGLTRAGTAAPCLIDRKEIFRAAVRGALPESDTAKVDAAQAKKALRAGEAAVFATRYSPTDRIAVLFGLGMSLIQANDAQRFKVINRRGQGADTSSKQFIVQESGSRSFPVATTGLAVRFRDRLPAAPRPRPERAKTLGNVSGFLATNIAWLYERAKPTTVFGSVQFGGGEEGAVSGTALGLGWRVVGDVHILAGFSITRLSTLRKDMLRQFKSDTTGVIPLPPGESEESVMGTQSEQALLIAFAVPLSLRGVFSGGR
jgi:hypothetical protein